MESSTTNTGAGATGEPKGQPIARAVATQGCCGTTSSAGCCDSAVTTSGDDHDILTAVREHYGTVASAVLANNPAGCCGGVCWSERRSGGSTPWRSALTT